MTEQTEEGSVYAETVFVPACTATGEAVDGNAPLELLVPGGPVTVFSQPDGTKAGVSADRTRFCVATETAEDGPLTLCVSAEDLLALPRKRSVRRTRWENQRPPSDPADVVESFQRAFVFDPPEGGLRPAQRGAVHAVLAHWTTGDRSPATVVMPTGTGKTDTMISLLVAGELERLLVVVPSDALRDQIGSSFECLGVLPEFGSVLGTVRRPVVGRVKHVFTSRENAETFVDSCNVVVATVAVIIAMSDDVRQAFLERFPTLFVDEAHHVGALKWRLIRDSFEQKQVVQFTATPYREDGRRLGGKLIYAYPLSEAQRQGFFAPIHYYSVPEFGQADRAIAEKALQVLRADLAAGHDHILMARVGRKARADQVLALYKELAPELKPVVAYSGLRAAELRAARTAIGTKDQKDPRTSRVLVCVNMFGEGFDLPQLKVAAIHDAHKSLGITLQFIGRFTRTAGVNIDAASVIVGRPDRDFDQKLRALYAEDSNWNLVVQDLSEREVGRQQDLSAFEQNFGPGPDDLAIQSLEPKMSAAVYRVPGNEDWNPIAVYQYFKDRLETEPIAINQTDAVTWFVTQNRVPVGWGDVKSFEDTVHTLYVLYFNREARLLYVNSSNTKSMHEGIADAVCPGAELIKGEPVYRVMAELDRLIPTNVGLLDARSSSRRFTFLVGPDVGEGFPASEAQTKSKTHIFSYGYDRGTRVNIGASQKGRVWSHLVAHDLPMWMGWCDHVGSKLNDDTISVDAVMANFIRPVVVKERPELVPLALEWPWELYLYNRPEFRAELNGATHPIIDLDLRLDLSKPSTTGPIRFTLASPDWDVEYELDFVDEQMQFKLLSAEDAVFVSHRGEPLHSVLDWLNEVGLLIHFEDDTLVEPPGVLYRPPGPGPLFDPDVLVPLDWPGVNLRVESRGKKRRTDSIQHRMIEYVETLDAWDVILDDDGKGEVADIVAMRIDDDYLVVHLTHCKYAINGTVGRRVDDLYDAVGQTNRSTKWKRSAPSLFDWLRRREKRRLNNGNPSGFVKGSAQDLLALEDLARGRRMKLTVTIAQPGVTAAGITDEQKALIAGAETYVKQTTGGDFVLYCSP